MSATGLVSNLATGDEPLLDRLPLLEVLKSFYNQLIEPPIYFYRDTNQKEIDVIIEQDGVIYPVEIKMTAKPTKKHATHFNTLKD